MSRRSLHTLIRPTFSFATGRKKWRMDGHHGCVNSAITSRSRRLSNFQAIQKRNRLRVKQIDSTFIRLAFFLRSWSIAFIHKERAWGPFYLLSIPSWSSITLVATPHFPSSYFVVFCRSVGNPGASSRGRRPLYLGYYVTLAVDSFFVKLRRKNEQKKTNWRRNHFPRLVSRFFNRCRDSGICRMSSMNFLLSLEYFLTFGVGGRVGNLLKGIQIGGDDW